MGAGERFLQRGPGWPGEKWFLQAHVEPGPPEAGDPRSVVPLAYGRVRTSGVELAAGEHYRNGALQYVRFVVLSEGEIADVTDLYHEGHSHPEYVIAGRKQFGWFHRVGVVGNTDEETEAEYDIDPTTNLRDQNDDYRTKTVDGPLSFTAYGITVNEEPLQGGVGPVVLSPKRSTVMAFGISGIKCQKYTAAGATDGSPVFVDNPIWQLIDLFTNTKHSPFGLAAADFDMAVCKPEADWAEVAIDSQEANTTITVTQGSPTTECHVGNTEGFAYGRGITIGVTANTIVQVVSDTELLLGTAETQNSGDIVIQKPARWESNRYLDKPLSGQQVIKDFLLCCIGFITYDAGKVQIRSERGHVAELLTDGGFEDWASATDLTAWGETTLGGTVNQETNPSHILAGSNSLRLTRTGAGTVQVSADNPRPTGLVPGAWYQLVFSFKETAGRSLACGIIVKNVTKVEGAQADGVTFVAGNGVGVLFASTTAFVQHRFIFRVPDDHELTDVWEIRFRHIGGASDDIWIDGATLRGPYAGYFHDGRTTDAGHELGWRGSAIKEGSFRWIDEGRDKMLNQIRVRFVNDGGDVGPDEISADDFDNQRDVSRVRSATIQAHNVTTRDQAQRIGDFVLAKIRTAGFGGKLRAGPAAIAVQPGDIVLVTHAVADWSFVEKRVTKKETMGLGKLDELFVEMELEDYVESIYSDTGPLARGVPTRPIVVVTLSLTNNNGRRIELGWVTNNDALTVSRWRVYKRSSAAVDLPLPNDMVGQTHIHSFIYQATAAEVDTTLYFQVYGWTDRGYLKSNELAVVVNGETDAATDANIDQFASQTNLVHNSDFSSGTGWTLTAAGLFGPKLFPTQEAGAPTRTGYSNPTNAMDDDADFADGTESPAGDDDGHDWGTFVGGVMSGRLTVEHVKVNLTGTGAGQLVEFSVDSGFSHSGTWDTGSSISTTSIASATEAMTGQDVGDVQVRALTNGGDVSNTANCRVSRIYFEEDATAGSAAIASGVLTIKGNSVGALSEAVHAFPVESTVATVKHLEPGSFLSARIACKRNTNAPDADLVVKLQNTAKTWEQVILTVPFASIDSNTVWKDYAMAAVVVDSGIPVGALQVVVESGSSESIDCDKLMIVKGKRIPQYLPHPSEQDGTGGVFGDYGTGGGGSGGWGEGGDRGGGPIEL